MTFALFVIPVALLLLARRTFRYSIFYLTALFAALLVDHYFPVAI